MQSVEPGRRLKGAGRGCREAVCRGAWTVAGVVGLGVVAGGMAVAGTKQPAPEYRLEMEGLGFPGVSAALLNQGTSMLTVNFVDNEHLLFTFSLRGLVPRIADDPPEHDDREVAAELVELKTGKVLAQTRWHMHDHSRYLWALGDGRFLVRIGNQLGTIAPMANFATGQAFQRVAFPHRGGTVEAVLISGDNKLVTVETKRPPKAPGDEKKAEPIVLDLYRISGVGTVESPLVAQNVAAVGAATPVVLPLDGDGYLRPLDRGKGRWSVVFEPDGGKEIPLAPVDSRCTPLLKRVGPGMYMVQACRGIGDSVVLAAYDFAKNEIWEEPLAPAPVSTVYALAPDAARFAMSRIISDVPVESWALATPDNSTQEVRVYQAQTGDLLFKMNCSPTFRTAENFDLSPDGMRVMVVRTDAIEVYRLPELSKTDREDLVTLRKLAPPAGSGKLDIKALLAGMTTETADKTAEQQAVAEQGGVVSAEATPSGDAGDSQSPRKPPTLLNPGEKPDFGKGNTPPE